MSSLPPQRIIISKHDTFRPCPKPEKVVKEKYDLQKATQKKKKVSGEGQVFKEIWSKRPHKSEISGERIAEAYSWNFLHVLPKAQDRYPLFKLYPKNIILGTKEEHDIWDQARHKAVGPKWEKMHRLEKELLEEYSKLIKPKTKQ